MIVLDEGERDRATRAGALRALRLSLTAAALFGAALFVPLLRIAGSVWLLAALVAVALVATAG